jgi:hypothetical protein
MLRWLAIGLAVASCESAPRAFVEGPVAPQPAHTREQVIAASDLQVSIAQGRLADAHDLATQLADMTLDVQLPAGRIAHAGDLATAGVELGNLAGACGGCHAASGVIAAIPKRTPPAESNALGGQMTRHAWGAARLWEGVSGPAEHAWLDGALVIAQTPCEVSTVMHGKPNVEAFELAEQLHDQAMRASAAGDITARANLLGEVMSTCASCHRILRPHPIMDSHPDAVARSR